MLAEALGDFDGTGAPDDRFLFFLDPSGTRVARMELPYGYSATDPGLLHSAVTADVRAVNLGGPADLALVEVGAGSGSRLAVLYAFHGCAVVRVRDPDATSDIFPGFALADAPREKLGVTCREDGIELTSATSLDGITWRATSRVLHWDPGSAVLYPDPGVGFVLILHSPEDDATIQSAADFHC